MTSMTPADDSRSASELDVPQVSRRYTCDMGGTTARKWRLPLDVKTCLISNDTDQTLTFYVAYYDGTTEEPSTNLHTAGTSSRIETVAAGAEFALAQHTQFNTLSFKAGSAATGSITLRPGYGMVNTLGIDVETRALTNV